jgi:hypothetical protein
MSNDFESFYCIDHWSVTGGNLTLRLIPDHYSAEIIDPVITAIVIETSNFSSIESGLKMRSEKVLIDIQASPRALLLWAEHDDNPLSIEGAEVQLIRSPYSAQDLARTVACQQQELDSNHAELVKVRNELRETEHFVAELLHRAATRKAMSSRDPSTSNAQIDVLERILARIRGGG